MSSVDQSAEETQTDDETWEMWKLDLKMEPQ